jgi:hypothetical protein
MFFINQDGKIDYSQFVEWEENWEFYVEDRKKLAKEEREIKKGKLICLE